MYTKTYKNFLGVDLSSERSEVDDRRFSYLKNLWRDYRLEDGAAIETAPGFSLMARFKDLFDGTRRKVNALHYLPARGEHSAKIIVHVGRSLYAYDPVKKSSQLIDAEYRDHSSYNIADARSTSVCFFGSLYLADGKEYVRIENGETVTAHLSENTGYIPTTYVNGEPYEQRNLLIDKVREIYSKSPTNRYVPHDPAVAVAVTVDGTLLTPFKRVSADTDTYTYCDKDGKEIEAFGANGIGESVSFGGSGPIYLGVRQQWVNTGEGESTLEEETFFYLEYTTNTTTEIYLLWPLDYTVHAVKADTGNGFLISDIVCDKPVTGELIIESDVSPQHFQSVGEFRDLLTGNPDMEASGGGNAWAAVNGCTLVTEFDGRIFLSGNPKLPNTVFYTQRDLTGYNNPFYVGAYNYLNDGTGNTPITALMTTPTQLIVLKDDAPEGSQIYYHYGADNPSTNSITANLQPRIYPRETGVAGVGCLGTAVNFLDDAVFLSKNGLEAIGRAQVNLERTLTHRSLYVDAALHNEQLREALAAEWEGYLCLLFPSGNMYLADSRLRTSHPNYGYQYEWYLWDDIGVYEDQDDAYVYVNDKITVEGYDQGFREGVTHAQVIHDDGFSYTLEEENGVTYAFAVACYGEKTGGVFKKPTALLSVDGKLYFACEDGALCVLESERNGRTIPIEKYTRNGRRYTASLATKSDDCGRTNLQKSTERGTFVVKSKSFPCARALVRVRTDREDWHDVDTIYTGKTDFAWTDFGAFTFHEFRDTISTVREREKRWVEKQILIEAECYGSPFGILSISYDFRATGKVRNT